MAISLIVIPELRYRSILIVEYQSKPAEKIIAIVARARVVGIDAFLRLEQFPIPIAIVP